MPKKAPRDRKVTLVKQKTVRAGGGENRHSVLDDKDIEEGKVAKELLDKRNTAEFSRNELGALMQIPPGGAEPHHIRTRSRQFNRQLSNAKPMGVISEGRTGGNTSDLDGGRIRRPRSGGPFVSRNNYKIDPED
jgi:hypothetical protein